MANENAVRETLNWLTSLQVGIAQQKEVVEKWCSCYRYSLSQLKKSSRQVSKEVEKTEDVPKSFEEVDFSEIDKILEKAKSVRVEATESKEKALSNPKKQRNAIKRHEQLVKEDARERKAVSAGVTHSKEIRAARFQKIAPRVTSRPKTVPSTRKVPKLEQKGVKNDEKDRLKTEERRKAVQAVKKQGCEKETELTTREKDEGHNPQPDTEIKLLNDKTEGVVNNEIVNICMKLRHLKKKLVNEESKNSRKNTLAKEKFIMDVKGLCQDSKTYSDTSSVLQLPTSSLERITRNSPLSQALALLDWNSTFSSVKEIQELCDSVMKYLELKLELEGKQIMQKMAENLLHSETLSKSEKIDVFRKMYCLLVENGERLPTMIDDSEVYELGVEEDA
ncbi:uncharacterized protein LOC135691977 isoform X2 [Rhopilema esculentum]|uniref:uncharacterized protein LOC135691977 isoform X2 n=1 Tax=Rhopilema esculentum TaxID=499914 RepID=UPI0031D691BF